MSNPLENKEFKHYLNFLNDRKILVEISEPVKFDASEFFLGQNDGYARDLTFMNDEIDLEFYEGFYEPTDTPYALPNGIIVDKLGHAFEWLLEYDRTFGFQSQVEYILERNGVQFSLGELNFEGRETDGYTYFKCKVVQATKRALAKRREDIKIDGFANEDLDGNAITPLTTTNILLKAKPVIQKSKWTTYQQTNFDSFTPNSTTDTYYFNSAINLTQFAIEDSYTPFLFGFTVSGLGNKEDFRYVFAQNTLTDIIITFRDLSFLQTLQISDIETSIYDLGATSTATLKIIIGDDVDSPIETYSQVLLSTTVTDGTLTTTTFNPLFDDISIEIPFVSSAYSIWVFIEIQTSTLGYNGVNFSYNFSNYSFDITTTATAIDTVIKGVRYKDVLNHSLKAINGNQVTAPEFENGGEFYDLFCFSGNLIRQRDDVPFYFTFKDRRENLMFVNADCQVNEVNAFALQYDKFYDNVDNGGFLLVPSDKFKQIYNDRYAINSLEYGFSTYEKDRDEENTLDAVHTQTQWSINNTRVANVKKIQNNDILDPFVIEANRAQTYKTTTALDTDNKMHVMDCVPLAPNYLEGFTALMTHNVNSDGYLQLLKDADLPSWSLLGFGVGDTFTIDNTANADDYTVIEITDNIITLEAQNITPIVILSTITQVSYYLTNVAYTNRTNEGFDLIEGIENPTKFGNLRYTIRRNLVHWESFMRTCAMYITDDIKNTEFINNGELRTQYNGGTIYQENANIVLNEIQDPILTPRLYDNDIIVEFDDALALFQKYEALETVGGFIRMMDNNGAIKKVYPQSLRYTWTTKVMNIIGEERYESEIVNVYRDGDNIVINEVYYSEETLPEVFYEANGDYVVLFDENNVNLINFTRYDKFIVQEGTFDNTIDLVQAIIDL